ncbi:MAG: GH3 auxin-responsive promoter family protein, partial [Bdellovibrionales bacterium]|nr:GH3 auxin-responsive promoter family protein [Bdellovibrionales bacterium]
ITEYSDWKDMIVKRKSDNPTDHFVPTSGSTHAIKWVLYTPKFKAELWKASSALIHDLYVRYPEIKKGTHYWSLSWLPADMRKQQSSNDLDFFVGLEKYLLEQTMTLDDAVAALPSLKDSMRQNLLSLLTKNVTLISIWSPTFLIEVLEQLINDKNYFLDHLKDAKKRAVIADLNKLAPENTKILFPELVLISAWATSSSKIYAEKIKKLFPHVSFEAKGLWATEGVLTIPFEKKFPIAVNSHFYEFEEWETKKIYPSWELKMGMKVMPIFTTGSLFFRYKLNDLLEVSEFYDKTPCLIFLGRQNETDLVGEKISTNLAQKILENFKTEFSLEGLSLLAVQAEKPHYRLLVECADKLEKKNLMDDFLENKLLEHFHYKLARELGQLQRAQVELTEDAFSRYITYREKVVAIKGNIKVEPLVLVK